jgi:uncharacterized OB-fold protein
MTAAEASDTGVGPLARRPAPLLTDDNAFFWEAAAQGRLVAQGCSECGRLRHPPRPMCPHCRSLEFEVVPLSGRGSLYSYAILHHPRHPAFDYPLVAALVDLEEGIRFVSNLPGVEGRDIEIGMALEVSFEATKNGGAVPVFRPVGADERSNPS